MQNNLNLIGRYKTSVLFFSYIISSINIQWDNIHITRQRQQGTSTSEKFRLRGASGLKRWSSWLKEVSARGRHKKHIQLESIYSVSQQTSNTHQLPFIRSGATPFHMHHRDYVLELILIMDSTYILWVCSSKNRAYHLSSSCFCRKSRTERRCKSITVHDKSQSSRAPQIGAHGWKAVHKDK